MGAVTSLGNTVSQTWQALLAGKSGAQTITDFNTDDLQVKFAARVKNFDPTLAMEVKEARKVDVFVQYAMEAARQAVEDANLQMTEATAGRAGVVVGSGIGGLPKIVENFEALEVSARRVSPFFIPGAIVNMIPGLISMKYHMQGPNYSIVSACATGGHNIGDAARLIRDNVADVMVAGGAEMSTIPLCIAGFSQARTLSRRNDAPEQASRPWDKGRDGFVLGEGAGVLVLEEYEHAKKRGAKIYAELIGFGMSADAYHMTAPEPNAKGFVLCIQNALADAKISPSDIAYINAHGTSTPTGDPIEALSAKLVFGDHAYQLAMSSTKSMLGHTLGAAGAIEAIITILAICDNVAPPTINLDHPDEGCDLNFVAHTAQPMKINTALSNSFGFGGTNTSLIFRRV
ncbi:MAG: beta-ketoacyl-[acyl-carrier-protein] synthase II [Coxiella sp. RIFCSPHIGHO2_12_FULL_42_15]|nr:MAG: beta-ketoacyl-[acyl-carrier-protein] synthase II [Coxiella sp. RIFCSPHIGHO2_12_FULL_42_15]